MDMVVGKRKVGSGGMQQGEREEGREKSVNERVNEV